MATLPKGRHIDLLYRLLYIVGMSKKVERKLIAVRIDPNAWHIARIASVTTKKTLGQWLEEAIRDKARREGINSGVVEERGD